MIHVLCQTCRLDSTLPSAADLFVGCRFFIVLSYAWGWLLSGEKPDKGKLLHPSLLNRWACMAEVYFLPYMYLDSLKKSLASQASPSSAIGLQETTLALE